ncbi:MAG: hypothetical protein KKD07_03225 [Candidatus Omnitrophica bacterium]|nr:hypothetical protein [Candidatus Omnitrophota bacterium]MBU1997521.1 hypothetical protein [Candidatus Omnitrophota bacterium]MBU4333434.1 hypothetical protein [Candidatus Omnitrophota bacterium]
MKKRLIVLTLLLMFFAANSFAHAPASVDLSYDQEKQVLKVKIQHVTQAVRKHYIRSIEVRKNDSEDDVYYFHYQKDNKLIEQDISIEAVAGDFFNVKVSCKQGGSTMASLVVEELVVEEEEKAKDVGVSVAAEGDVSE